MCRHKATHLQLRYLPPCDDRPLLVDVILVILLWVFILMCLYRSLRSRGEGAVVGTSVHECLADPMERPWPIYP